MRTMLSSERRSKICSRSYRKLIAGLCRPLEEMVVGQQQGKEAAVTAETAAESSGEAIMYNSRSCARMIRLSKILKS